jgi:hypothetical protein
MPRLESGRTSKAVVSIEAEIRSHWKEEERLISRLSRPDLTGIDFLEMEGALRNLHRYGDPIYIVLQALAYGAQVEIRLANEADMRKKMGPAKSTRRSTKQEGTSPCPSCGTP